ncbi:MAG: T9SS type A sorting domain-containing protein [Saprospiraceae bacterium]
MVISNGKKIYGGSESENVYSIQQTPDGGFIAAGESDSSDGDVTENKGLFDVWVVKLDTAGNIQWEKSLGGSQDDRANAVRVAGDGGYFIGGQTFSSDGDVTELAGINDFWILKLDTSGSIEWQKTFGGSLFDEAMTIDATIDGGVIAAGYTYSFDGDVTENKGAQDVWLTKLDSTGQLQWQKSFGGSVDDIVFGIDQTTDGGFIAAGGTSSLNDGDITGHHGKWDFWLLKLNDAGNLVWQQTYGGSNFDVAYSIDETTDGGYVVAGYTNSTDGDVTNPKGSRDMWIVKLASITGVYDDNVGNAFRIYPNPTSGIIKYAGFNNESWDNIEVVAITGKNIQYKLSTAQQVIDVGDLTPGIYFIRFKNKNGIFTKKLVKS